MDAPEKTPPESGSRFADALNQPIPPPQHRDFADAVLGMPPGEAEFLQELKQAVGDQAERSVQRIEESQKIRDAVLQHLFRVSGRAR